MEGSGLMHALAFSPGLPAATLPPCDLIRTLRFPEILSIRMPSYHALSSLFGSPSAHSNGLSGFSRPLSVRNAIAPLISGHIRLFESVETLGTMAWMVSGEFGAGFLARYMLTSPDTCAAACVAYQPKAMDQMIIRMFKKIKGTGNSAITGQQEIASVEIFCLAHEGGANPSGYILLMRVRTELIRFIIFALRLALSCIPAPPPKEGSTCCEEPQPTGFRGARQTTHVEPQEHLSIHVLRARNLSSERTAIALTNRTDTVGQSACQKTWSSVEQCSQMG